MPAWGRWCEPICQVRGVGEVGAVACFGAFAGRGRRRASFADAGRSDQQDVGGGVEVAVGGEVADQGVVDAGLGVVVEVLKKTRPCLSRLISDACLHVGITPKCFGHLRGGTLGSPWSEEDEFSAQPGDTHKWNADRNGIAQR